MEANLGHILDMMGNLIYIYISVESTVGDIYMCVCRLIDITI